MKFDDCIRMNTIEEKKMLKFSIFFPLNFRTEYHGLNARFTYVNRTLFVLNVWKNEYVFREETVHGFRTFNHVFYTKIIGTVSLRFPWHGNDKISVKYDFRTEYLKTLWLQGLRTEYAHGIRRSIFFLVISVQNTYSNGSRTEFLRGIRTEMSNSLENVHFRAFTWTFTTSDEIWSRETV